MVKRYVKENLYELLQIQPNADEEVIKGAWKGLMKKIHPDHDGRNSVAVKLNNAKSILLDINKRKEYDEFLTEKELGLINNYKILGQIGEGGFGRIFQAEHVLLGEKACLKQNKNNSKKDTELLKLEAKVLWKLNEYHSIPSTKDFFKVADNNYVLVLDYIKGKTLQDIVENNSRLHPEDVCWITERLLGALYYCHCNGVIHGDIKPENIFIETKKHDIKLIDFGLAAYKPKSNTVPSGYTPRYAAPELSLGKPPIPETDLYGAGITMLYALGGNIEKKHIPTDVPKEINDFCVKLIRYDPTKRPNWDKENLIDNLSNLRAKVFGRRHMSDKK